MASNYTKNYGLCQWKATDQVLHTEFNEDNQKIDAALVKHDEALAQNAQAIQTEADARTNAVATLTAELIKRGNCKIEVQSYDGTGYSGANYPTRITFSKQPLLFLILGQTQFMAGSKHTERGTVIKFEGYGASVSSPYLTWSGNRVSFYGNDDGEQMNGTNITYWVFSMYAEDEA